MAMQGIWKGIWKDQLVTGNKRPQSTRTSVFTDHIYVKENGDTEGGNGLMLMRTLC